MFRNADPESHDEVPPLGPDIKTEVVEEVQAGSSTSLDESSSPVKKATFVQIKNRQVFDYEPNASSIHASHWPHWWLKAVQSRHKLRKAEAKKNVRFKNGLLDLLREALEVRTIFIF